MSKKDKDSAAEFRKQLDRWLERDLGEAAAEGELSSAFRQDYLLARISEVLDSGRSLILAGEAGVGKTALLHETFRRAARGEGPEVLRGKRILQLSIRRCSSTVKPQQESVGSLMMEFIQGLGELGDDTVLYFRDFHLCWNFDLENAFTTLPFRLPSPVICEGLRGPVRSCLEHEPELEGQYLLVDVEEPSMDRTREILTAWAQDRAGEGPELFTAGALETALQLSHRFLARSRQPRKSIDPLQRITSLRNHPRPVTEGHVIERFCESYSIPRFLIDPAIPLDLDRLHSDFRQRILGQEEALSAVIDMISRIKAGMVDPRGPFGSFLFVGPTGVGKTHLAQLLAESLFGSQDRLIRLNMADYQEDNSADLLFGDPNDNRISHRRGVLTQRIMGHPFAVLLLDEFEKAGTKVHDRFLQLIDEGCFMNAAGERVSCRSLILIATSNAGAELWRGGGIGFAGAGDEATVLREVDLRLRECFRHEFLNRFDHVVHFRPLQRKEVRAIALRELELLRRRPGLRLPGLELQVDEGVLDWLTAHGYDPLFGARFLRRTIERDVTTALAALLVRETPEPGATVELVIRANRVRARLVRGATPAPRRETVTLPEGTQERTQQLDRAELLRRAEELAEPARRRLHDLEHRREEHRSLLSEINDPAFWDGRSNQQMRLDRFRQLDVAIRVESRLAVPVEGLLAALSDRERPVEELARVVEAAAHALREWDERNAEDSASSVWIVISNQDALRDAGDWISDLVRMEKSWCRRLQLETEVVAYSVVDGQLARVGLEATGPGAEFYLAMEQGLHRRHRRRGQHLRARVQVLSVSDRPADPPSTRELSRAPELFGVVPAVGARLEVDARGLVEEFVGTDAGTLAHFLADYRQAMTQVDAEGVPVARVYGEDGSGARDPRTDEVVPRLRDALNGRLDRLLDSWRRSHPPSGEA